MNTVQIMGFLGKDPVIRATQTGRAMANMIAFAELSS